MSRRAPKILLATAAVVLPLAALARAPYTPPGADDALLRFSWRMSISAREDCRPRTTEELEALPVHMRTPEVCTADRSAYSLVTRIGEAPADTVALLRGGVKGDRPLFVLEERSLEPGRHRVSVELHREAGSGDETLATLDTVLAMRPGAVQLVTLDAEGQRLVVRSSNP